MLLSSRVTHCPRCSVKPPVLHARPQNTSKWNHGNDQSWRSRLTAAALRTPTVPLSSKNPKNSPVLQRGKGRTIVVAVDGKSNGIEGLQWLVDNCFNADDSIVLVTVVNNDRALPVSVGMTAPTGRILTISLDDFDDYAYKRTKAYGKRLATVARAHVDEVYVPLVAKAGFNVEAHVNVVEGHTSAASIAESIVKFAQDRNADILAVTSHGGGLKCSYGSVARYCVAHFKKAILLLPPGMDSHCDRSSPSISVGVSQLKELQDATSWGVQNLMRSGDKVHVLHGKEAAVSVEDATHQIAIMAGLREQFKRHKIKALTYTMIQPGEDAKEDADDFNMHSSSALLAVAAKKHSKALVMVNYAARGLMQEMMFGTLAMLVSRSCTMPLALIPPDYAVE